MGKFVPQPKTLGGESNLETPVETQADGAPLFRISDLSVFMPTEVEFQRAGCAIYGKRRRFSP